MKFCTVFILLIATFAGVANVHSEEISADVIIYGGTSAGVAAAVQVARMGKTAVIIEPSSHLGGLTSGGLGATDIGNKAAIGGISREFYQAVKTYYEDEQHWTLEKSADYASNRQVAGEDAMWTFEPHVAELLMERMSQHQNIRVCKNQRLDRSESGIGKTNSKIQWIQTENGDRYCGKVFLDTTYEGDLLDLAGVRFFVGREANSIYQETLNGVQTAQATKHQLQPGIDPYVTAGDPTSGLLPGIDPNGPGEEGGADHRVQAYCFRMCNTTLDSNRIPFAKPDSYNPLDYELLFRNFAAGAKVMPWHPIAMPNRKTDTNNNRGFSTDFIGESYNWATATYQERDAIFAKHLTYQQGLMWTLANHERIPASVREYFSKWGNCRDEFTDNGGWPHQLYVREARRMVADYVMTQHHCQGKTTAEFPVGMAAYTMDSHNVQRYVDQDGNVRNEGDVQVGGFPPYPIDYRSITPKQDECDNLLVPVCLSASHIAYGSIRMEPVFMVLGQSAATAAVQSLEQNSAVQKIDMTKLVERLKSDKQVLTWQTK
ncbi:MAG: FAD-dependent oxidoreductase [Planctomycetales bacterium]|nr:FAD-dependent oxidoreductase [Planctomycetales bacterium]